MYLGKIVEVGDRQSIYERPRHPYTHALLSAVPEVAVPEDGVATERIRLAGDVPSPIDPPSGCRFHPRCPRAQEVCAAEQPVLEGTVPEGPVLEGPVLGGTAHLTACHFPIDQPVDGGTR